MLTGNRYKKCVREDKNIGYCVPDSMCFENLTINTGGDIPDGELRYGTASYCHSPRARLAGH